MTDKNYTDITLVNTYLEEEREEAAK